MLECLNVLDPGGCPCGYLADSEYGVCVCIPSERVLRLYAGGAAMPALTTEQRTACLDEIAHVEGYERKDYEASSDSELARGVLYAWADYCRDKGLL